MPIEVKQFSCPKCGAPLELKNAGLSKSIICSSCSSQIDLTTPDYQVVGSVGERMAPQVTQFAVGMQGMLGDNQCEIIGRVVYHDEEGDIWDEWLLLSQAGEYIWISDSENEGMAAWRAFTPTDPIEPYKLSNGDQLNLRDAKVTVRDTGRAKIDYLEGELTWKAKVGDWMSYVEADGEDQRISIEYTENEVEFYWGERLYSAGTAKAFGVTEEPPPPSSGNGGGFLGGMGGGGGIITVIIIVILIVIFVASGGNLSSGSSSGGSRGSSHSFSGGGHGGGGGGGGGK